MESIMKKYLSVFLLSFILLSVNLDSQVPSWKHQITVDGGISVPFAKYTEMYKLNTGYGFSGTYYFKFNESKKFFFSASVGYYSFVGNFWQFPEYSNSLNVIPFQIGLKYNFQLSVFQPYIGYEAGIITMNSISDMKTEGKTTINEYTFGMTPKFGLTYPLVSNLYLDANIKIMYVIYQEIGTIQYYNHGQLGLNFGINYAIGD
jgi:hypothetical protein